MQSRVQTAQLRLSSGLRVNSASDDAAGLAVANKMQSQLRGMNIALKNTADGLSLLQTAIAGMQNSLWTFRNGCVSLQCNHIMVFTRMMIETTCKWRLHL